MFTLSLRAEIVNRRGKSKSWRSSTPRKRGFFFIVGLFLCATLTSIGGCVLNDPTNPYEQPAFTRSTPETPTESAKQVTPNKPSLERSRWEPGIVGGPLSLEEAKRLALAHNPLLAAADQDFQAAQARYHSAAGARLPRLGVVGGYAHHIDPQRAVPARPPDDYPPLYSRELLSSDLVLTVPLFTGGRLVNQVRAAKLLEEAAGHSLAQTRNQLIFNVSSLFFQILAQEKVVESFKFSVETLEEHLERVKALVQAEKAANVDRMRTAVRLADVKQRLVQSKNVVAIQRRALASLLGMANPGSALAVKGDLGLKLERSVPDLETALTQARLQRDDYLAARAALEAQARKVDVARAGHLPIFYLRGSYGGRAALGSTSGSGEKQEDMGQLGVGLEMPIFEGGQISAEVREQRAVLQAAGERLRDLELQMQLDVESAVLNVQSARERVDAIRAAVEEAHESLRIERDKYNLGRGAIVDVLDSQGELLDIQTTYQRALADAHIAWEQLRLATGEEL